MKIIKNFKKLEDAEFPRIRIKEDEDVFAELPICLVEYGVILKDPILFGNEAIERAALDKLIEGTKLFHFKLTEEGRVEEVDEALKDFSTRLPIDVEVSKLAIINGELGLLEDEV